MLNAYLLLTATTFSPLAKSQFRQKKPQNQTTKNNKKQWQQKPERTFKTPTLKVGLQLLIKLLINTLNIQFYNFQDTSIKIERDESHFSIIVF